MTDPTHWARGRSLTANGLWVQFALCLLLVLGGCTGARKQVRGDVVRKLQFEGRAEGTSDGDHRSAISQKKSSWGAFVWPFTYWVQAESLAPGTLRKDGQRLRIWYAEQGYFDMRFLGWEVRRIKKATDDKAGVVDIRGYLEPGPRSSVRHMDYSSLEGTGAIELLMRNVTRTAPIRAGDPFDAGLVRRTAKMLEEALRENTFAYASVVPLMDAYPEEQAVDVQIEADVGVSATIGPITVSGEGTYDDKLLRVAADEVYLEEGEAYSLSRMRQAQQDLFRMQLFSVVSVSPDLSDPTRTAVPVNVEIQPGRTKRLRAGGAVTFDTYNLVPRGTIEYRDLRLGHSLVQLDARASVGAIIGVTSDTDLGGDWAGLVGDVGMRVRYPFLAKNRLAISSSAKAFQEVQYGNIPYWGYSVDALLAWRIARKIQFTSGPVFDFFSYRGDSGLERELAAIQFQGDFNSTAYNLLGWVAGIVADFRDDPLSPSRGTYVLGGVKQSIPIPTVPEREAGWDGDPVEPFLYTRFRVDARAYKSFRLNRKQRRLPLTLAGLGRGTILVPWEGADSSLPYPDLGFAGGTTSLRSFRNNQVGPYDCVCAYERGRPSPPHNNGEFYDVDRTYLPRGGALVIEAIGEARYAVTNSLSVALFGEMGLLSSRVRETSADDLRFGAGVGGRIHTPVGPVRLDLGFRPTYPEDFGPERYIGCNTIDQIPRGYDLTTPSLRARQRIAERNPVMAVNFFLAIGEAF